MKLDEALKAQCALALDSVVDLIPEGFPVLVSIVVSHPGRGHSDAIVVGTHSLAELAEVAVGMTTTAIRTGDVDSAGYRADPGSALQ